MHWFDLTGNMFYWQIPLTDAKIGSNSFYLGINYNAVIDTGTSLIVIPNEDFSQLA